MSELERYPGTSVPATPGPSDQGLRLQPEYLHEVAGRDIGRRVAPELLLGTEAVRGRQSGTGV